MWQGLGKHVHMYLWDYGAASEPRPNVCLEIWVKMLQVPKG